MSSEESEKRKAYAVFLDGTAQRLLALLQTGKVDTDEISGEFERNLISAIEIISGSQAEFIDDGERFGYQFLYPQEHESESPHGIKNPFEELQNYPIWKAVQKNLDNPALADDLDAQFSIEDKYRIVLEQLSSPSPTICEREGIDDSTLIAWTLEFLNAGREAIEKDEVSKKYSFSQSGDSSLANLEIELARFKQTLIDILLHNEKDPAPVDANGLEKTPQLKR